MDTFRRFPTLDPQLPVELLPANWLRDPAREVFAAVYDKSRRRRPTTCPGSRHPLRR
ncbi:MULTISPECIES: PaaX family transcriptional regulator C-terminal domain-containing protein [unclassified Solwaraspora]|uniref:PaaX family transcriptional regulator C-terminal domain-containing protein n=1 Tax=unclassified Solwaraspora TaxID=2627926 RepID=UPI0032B2274B